MATSAAASATRSQRARVGDEFGVCHGDFGLMISRSEM